MGGRLLEGPTMVGRTSDWKEELRRSLKRFLDRLGHKARRQMCPMTYRIFRTNRWGWRPRIWLLEVAKRNQVSREGAAMTEPTPSPLNNVITLDDDRIKNHLDRVVRGSVEETLNALLD